MRQRRSICVLDATCFFLFLSLMVFLFPSLVVFLSGTIRYDNVSMGMCFLLNSYPMSLSMSVSIWVCIWVDVIAKVVRYLGICAGLVSVLGSWSVSILFSFLSFFPSSFCICILKGRLAVCTQLGFYAIGNLSGPFVDVTRDEVSALPVQVNETKK